MTYFAFQMYDFDVLVLWDCQGLGENVVKASQIKLDDKSKWRRGEKINMWWPEEGKWYTGECYQHFIYIINMTG